MPAVAQVSRTLLWVMTNVTRGTIISSMLAAPPIPVQLIEIEVIAEIPDEIPFISSLNMNEPVPMFQ